jgi:hypothetical protein
MRATLSNSATFVVASISTYLVTSGVYGDLTHPGAVTIELLLLLAAHFLGYLRIWLSRELLLNFAFVGYMLLSLAWTDNGRLALITTPSIVNTTTVLIFFSALAAYHNVRALLAGMIAGYVIAALLYTFIQGFPFIYPRDFSYNAIAGMYLFGLFLTSLYGAYAGMRLLPLAAGAVFLLLIGMTTSIKTNLGVALGIAGSALLYFRRSVKTLVRGALVVAALGAAVGYTLSANPDLTEKLMNGYGRVSLGVAVLTNREGDSGTTGLGQRKGWQKEGLKGWAATPVFGHGVEAFRSDFGITSHSTPIDLLYNSGLIGTSLFYAMFASLAARLLRSRNPHRRGVRARITMCLIAYVFISISGIIYYDPFVAAFIGLSSGLLVRTERSWQSARARSDPAAAAPLDAPISSA